MPQRQISVVVWSAIGKKLFIFFLLKIYPPPTFLVNHLITEIMQMLLKVAHCCSLIFQMNASLLKQLVLFGLMAKDRLWPDMDQIWSGINQILPFRYQN